jgi:hypothetical protein
VRGLVSDRFVSIYFVYCNKTEATMSKTKRPATSWDMSEAYKEYAKSKPSVVENERMRPEGQDIFDWLLEDKDLIHETDEALAKAGFKL